MGDTAKGCALCVCGAVPYIRRKGKAKSCKEEEKKWKKSQRVNRSTSQRVFGADGGGGVLFSDPADPSDPSDPSLVGPV